MSEEKEIKVVKIPDVDPTASVDTQIKQAELAAKLLELEIKKQALEAQTLEIEERKYHIQDLKAKLTERDIAEKQAKEDREFQGKTFAQQEATDLFRFRSCSHKKGGMASPRDLRVLSTGGNAAQYAVMKHQMINGDIWVRCLRCGGTWRPPVESNFFFDKQKKNVAPADGTFDQVKFDKAVEEYRRATMFETNNSMSSSVQCRFSEFDIESGKMVDATETYRRNIASTNLR